MYYTKGKIINFIFYLLLVSSTIGYLGYYFNAVQQNVIIFRDYGNYRITVGAFSEVLRYLKDILILVLTLLSLCNPINKKKKRIYLIALGVFSYGVFVLFLWGNYSNTAVISGARGLVYLFGMILYVLDWKYNKPSLKIIYRITVICLFVQCLVIWLQMNKGISGSILRLVGRGGYRFPGLFGSFGGVAYFALGASMFVCIYWSYLKKTTFIKYFIIQMFCVLLTICAGSRAAFICVAVFNIITLASNINIKTGQKILFVTGVIIISLPFVIWYIQQFVDRGNIVQVQLESGRLLILYKIIFQNPLQYVLFGKGLGYGTNSYVMMQKENNIYITENNIMDGTINTVLVQFGLIGMFFFGFLCYKVIKQVKKNKQISIYIKMAVFFVSFLFFMTANFLEQYAFLIFFVLVYFILIEDREMIDI